MISSGASLIGSICGICGGIIIKPTLDAFGVLEVAVISFLSSYTVLSMSCYSIGKAWVGKSMVVDVKRTTPLAIGAALGGVAGTYLLQLLFAQLPQQKTVSIIQTSLLLIQPVGTLLYTLMKQRIKTKNIHSPASAVGIGALLGSTSAFLGIGGGPVNPVVLQYFFSMPVKAAAQSSLYIILFSQVAGILNTVLSGRTPTFSVPLLLLMVAGGIFVGILVLCQVRNYKMMG